MSVQSLKSAGLSVMTSHTDRLSKKNAGFPGLSISSDHLSIRLLEGGSSQNRLF